MRSSTSLAETKPPFVADASAVINLIATGCAPSIIRAAPRPVVVVDVIPRELDTGRPRGRKDSDRLQELATAGDVEIVSLGDLGWYYFETLVAGPAADTLDDGEAATIAYAAEYSAIAVLDETKATRICGTRFPALRLISTTDILLHPDVCRTLGEEALSDAVFAALREARMRVFPHHLADVARLIGPQRASLCQSLPRIFRSSIQDVRLADASEGA